MDLQAEVVYGHQIPKVPIQTIRLLDYQYAASIVLLEKRDHLAKATAAGLFSCFHILKLLRDLQFVVQAVVSKKVELGGHREALALLLLGGNTSINDSRSDLAIGARV